MNMDNVDVMFSSLVGKAKQYQEMELEQLQAYGASRGFDEDIEVYDVEFLKRKQARNHLANMGTDLLLVLDNADWILEIKYLLISTSHPGHKKTFRKNL